MASRTNPIDNKTDEIQEDLQVFASLWSSLRAKYEGTNITKTIARLLHMYQPEDGINAYERLLKTVSVLLEDFDANGLRLLVSMVPPPKNTSDDTVKDIFFKATGFVRLETPMFHQNQSLIPAVVNPSDDVKNCYQSSQATPQEFYTLINQNYQKMNYYPATNGQVMLESGNVHQGYKMNWIPTPFIMQNGNSGLSNSYRDFLVKTEDNKLMRVPMANYGVLMSRDSQNIQGYHPYQLISTNRYPIEKNSPATSTLSSPPENPSIQEKNPPAEEKKSEEKAKFIDENNEPSLLENLTASKNLEACIDRFLIRVKNNVDLNTKRNNSSLKNIEMSSNERKEFFHSRDINYSQNDANDWARNCYMKNCDMMYKRQYYDSVLNFQRAKAVTPMPSTSTYDSSYYEYLQQQQWIYQHQQRLIMGHQYAQRLAQPDFSTLRNPYSRSNEWISHCATSRHSQEGYGINPGYYNSNVHPNYKRITQSNNPQSSNVQVDSKKLNCPKIETSVKENGK